MRHAPTAPPGHPDGRPGNPGDALVCGRPAELLLQEIERFHGFPAPGVVIGAFMVDLAREQVGADTEVDAVVETCRGCREDGYFEVRKP